MAGARNLAESDHIVLCLELQTVRGLKKEVCLHFFFFGSLQLVLKLTVTDGRYLGLNQHVRADCRLRTPV